MTTQTEFREMMAWIQQNKTEVPDEELVILEQELVQYCARSERRDQILKTLEPLCQANSDSESEQDCTGASTRMTPQQAMDQYYSQCRKMDQVVSQGFIPDGYMVSEDFVEIESNDTVSVMTPPNTPISVSTVRTWAERIANQ